MAESSDVNFTFIYCQMIGMATIRNIFLQKYAVYFAYCCIKRYGKAHNIRKSATEDMSEKYAYIYELYTFLLSILNLALFNVNLRVLWISLSKSFLNMNRRIRRL